MNVQIFTVLLICLSLKSDSVRDTEYCCIACSPGKQHTVCQYPKRKPSEACENLKRNTVTNNERADVLRKHNELRQYIANGFDRFPKASNMLEMIWDDEVEMIAKRWSDTCNPGHDPCRNSLRFSIGQNIATGTVNEASEVSKYLETCVDLWFQEYPLAPIDQLINYTRKFPNGSIAAGFGHFTQVITDRSYRLGCALTANYIKSNSFTKVTLICNYGPAGNTINRRIYKKGEPCSACPSGTSCSTKYPGLCALRCSKLQPQYCAWANSIKPFWKQKAIFVILCVLYFF